MAKTPETPVERFRKYLLTDETSGDSVLADLAEQDLRKFCNSPGGRLLLEQFENKRLWASEQMMAMSPSDSEKISFLQAFHFFCTEFMMYLTPTPEDEDV